MTKLQQEILATYSIQVDPHRTPFEKKIYDWYEEHKFLTKKQVDAVKRINHWQGKRRERMLRRLSCQAAQY